MKRKIIIPTLILIVVSVAALLIKETSNNKIAYMEIPIEKAIIYEQREKSAAESSVNPTCATTKLRGNKYQASIIPSKGEKVEILSVQKSVNVGIDVIYKIHKLPDNTAAPEGKSIEFKNIFDSPIGFVLAN
jgi:hypothetical protein